LLIGWPTHFALESGEALGYSVGSRSVAVPQLQLDGQDICEDDLPKSGSDTDTSKNYEYTDWVALRTFLLTMLNQAKMNSAAA
jgi:hypothetical protein